MALGAPLLPLRACLHGTPETFQEALTVGRHVPLMAQSSANKESERTMECGGPQVGRGPRISFDSQSTSYILPSVRLRSHGQGFTFLAGVVDESAQEYICSDLRPPLFPPLVYFLFRLSAPTSATKESICRPYWVSRDLLGCANIF